MQYDLFAVQPPCRVLEVGSNSGTWFALSLVVGDVNSGSDCSVALVMMMGFASSSPALIRAIVRAVALAGRRGIRRGIRQDAEEDDE